MKQTKPFAENGAEKGSASMAITIKDVAKLAGVKKGRESGLFLIYYG